jgi:DNA-binding NarL/FixJ family response regulator
LPNLVRNVANFYALIYSASPLVARIDEATSNEELCYKIEHTQPEFVVVHQSLITDISLLPRGHFVILATELDETMLLVTYRHGGGYFPDNPLPVAMLLAALNPTGVAWVLEYLSRTESPNTQKVLTAREQTILALWNEGFTSSDIAEQLILSNGTVKKELETIRKKLQKHHVSGIMRKGRVKKERTYKKIRL